MTVVINALSAREGGAQNYLANLLRFDPPAEGMRVLVLAPPGLGLPELGRGIACVRVSERLAQPVLRIAWERLILPRVLARLSARILFCPGGTIGTRAPDGCRTVTMCRNMLPFSPEIRRKYPLGYTKLRLRLLEPLLLRNMRSADLVIFVSDYARRVVMSRAGGLMRTALIPHGVDQRLRRPPSAAPRWLPATGYFLYVSIVDVYKAQLEVVRAFAVVKRHGVSQKLVLVGRQCRPYAAWVRAEVARLGLAKEVIMPGTVPHEQMPALYRDALLNVFASECENCPNVLLEAMAAGRGLVVSARPPMPEFAADGALYFDPAKPEELADRILLLLRDPRLRRDLGRRAETLSRHYDWAETARRTWTAILGLVDAGPATKTA